MSENKIEQWLVEEECLKCVNYRPQHGIAPSGCKLAGTTLIGRRSAEDTNPCPELLSKHKIIFKHAGTDYVLSNLTLRPREYHNTVHFAFLQFYSTKVILKISRWDNSRYDYEKKEHIHYRCVSIDISGVLKGVIDSSLQGFIQFLEYCFNFNIIDICDNKLKRIENNDRRIK
jgi:hypothetical protein